MRQVPNLIFLAGLLGTSPILSAQVGQAIEIPLRPSEPDYYAWITQLSIGQTAWSRNPQDSVVGRRYRAAVLTSEIFSTLIIELVTLGTEACCAKVAWSRRVDMEAFRRQFGLGGELAGLVAGDWRSDRSFEFTIHRRHFLAMIDEGPRLTIQEL